MFICKYFRDQCRELLGICKYAAIVMYNVLVTVVNNCMQVTVVYNCMSSRFAVILGVYSSCALDIKCDAFLCVVLYMLCFHRYSRCCNPLQPLSSSLLISILYLMTKPPTAFLAIAQSSLWCCHCDARGQILVALVPLGVCVYITSFMVTFLKLL